MKATCPAILISAHFFLNVMAYFLDAYIASSGKRTVSDKLVNDVEEAGSSVF